MRISVIKQSSFIFAAEYATARYIVITGNEAKLSNVYALRAQAFKCPKLPIKVLNIQLSAPRRCHEARKRVAQCTLVVHEHTQASDEWHIRRRLSYVSTIVVITSECFELPFPLTVA